MNIRPPPQLSSWLRHWQSVSIQGEMKKTTNTIICISTCNLQYNRLMIGPRVWSSRVTRVFVGKPERNKI